MKNEDCSFCGPDNKAVIRITACTMDGEVLDTIYICRECFDRHLAQSSELEIGDYGKNKK